MSSLATVLAGVVDIGVAWYLIPAHGAVGACIGSGAAQMTAVGMMWVVGIYILQVKLPWRTSRKIIFSSVAAVSDRTFHRRRVAAAVGDSVRRKRIFGRSLHPLLSVARVGARRSRTL